MSCAQNLSEKPYCGIREYSWLRAVAQSVGNVVKNSGPGAIRRQKELFGLLYEIRYENPFAIEQTARWGRLGVWECGGVGVGKSVWGGLGGNFVGSFVGSFGDIKWLGCRG